MQYCLRSSWLAFLFSLVLSGCPSSAVAPMGDAGADGGCSTDADCTSTSYCQIGGACVAGQCVGSRPRCMASQVCDEANRRCVNDCGVATDADGDGSDAITCGGTDCDDTNANRHPGAVEVCDTANVDEDCDPSTFGVRDGDGDGYPDAHCCNGTTCGNDCNDTMPGTNPAVPEVCNSLDDDCDGAIDEALLRTFTIDADGDGHGSNVPGAMTMTACNEPAGYVVSTDDCDDADPRRAPNLPEICDMDMRDEDCSGVGNDVQPDGCTCTPGHSETCGTMGRCTGATRRCTDGQWEVCSIVPTDETCNGIDDDCDGMIDETLTVTCWIDTDGDGFPASGMSSRQCRAGDRAGSPWNGCPVGYTGMAPSASTLDCCDSDAFARPNEHGIFTTPSVCRANGFDYNCDGVQNDGDDLQSCGSALARTICTSGFGVGWLTAAPACGVNGTWVTACTWNGTACVVSTTDTRPRGCR